MQGNRSFYVRKKPTLVLNKGFPLFSLEVGTKGQFSMQGIVEGQRIEQIEDGTEYFLKTVRVTKATLINQRMVRND